MEKAHSAIFSNYIATNHATTITATTQITQRSSKMLSSDYDRASPVEVSYKNEKTDTFTK